MKHWLMFWGLGTIWGSSFLLIKIGVEELGPLPLVSVRIGLAALVMGVYLWLSKRKSPRTRREIIALLYVGVMNTALPFTLITWGEQDIDSGLATVLNSTVPLFTLVFAHFALSDERISFQKIIGLGVGFVGIVLLASRDAESSSPNPRSGQVAVLAAYCHSPVSPPCGSVCNGGCLADHRWSSDRYHHAADGAPLAGHSRSQHGCYCGSADAGDGQHSYRVFSVLPVVRCLGRDPDHACDLCHAANRRDAGRDFSG
jgi:uncharacterized membrane protein